ncbi:hypothetical protein K1719_037368 [Acacia pycnantha]|nr:hypothetical protein K1719_037368 [Acacia pycnantha]
MYELRRNDKRDSFTVHISCFIVVFPKKRNFIELFSKSRFKSWGGCLLSNSRGRSTAANTAGPTSLLLKTSYPSLSIADMGKLISSIRL